MRENFSFLRMYSHGRQPTGQQKKEFIMKTKLMLYFMLLPALETGKMFTKLQPQNNKQKANHH